MEECTSYRRIHEPSGVRKDNDFFSRLPLLEEDYDRLILQVTSDLDFLSDRLKVIDYSWLGLWSLSIYFLTVCSGHLKGCPPDLFPRK